VILSRYPKLVLQHFRKITIKFIIYIKTLIAINRC